ncbi:MAG: RlpA-like double-psi beta-barrel domain-containing protein [Candidatus Moranbacteria bacterium]|nr:RlpA-like double-psi beta-barrel domain-containing protein [Candidatus Moranbacteria bacterium]
MYHVLRIGEKRGARRKGLRFFSFLIALLFLGALVYFYFEKSKSEEWNKSDTKTITVTDGGLEFPFANVAEKTVGEFLASKKLSLSEGDSIFPNETEPLFSGTHIIIARAHVMVVRVDGGETILYTQATTVEQALKESSIVLDEDDIVKPGREAFAENGIKVVVTRVKIEEQTVEKPIAFAKKINEDSKLSWRKVVVTEKGEKGIERLTYRVSTYDGKEVNRKLLKTETIKDPTVEITTQGTYVQVGKTHKGAASWYAFTGTMSAANPWLPIGSYVRVTNVENGKSVIVRINDRGPFVPGRIIDLDKVAFQKIASIGAGVIGVTMEEIVN